MNGKSKPVYLNEKARNKIIRLQAEKMIKLNRPVSQTEIIEDLLKLVK